MRKLALGFFFLGVSSFLGCTAILGSFDVGPKEAGNPDGASDASGSETSLTDAGGDGDAAANFLLSCGVVDTSIIAIDTSVNGYDKNPFDAYRLDGGRYRVVVRRASQGTGGPGIPSFSVVTVSMQNGVPQSQGLIDAPNGAGQVIDTVRLQGGIGIVTFDIDADAGGGIGTLYMRVLQDNNPAWQPPVQLAATLALPFQGARVGGRVRPMSADGSDMFVALSYQASNNQFNWAAGRKKPGFPVPNLAASSAVIQQFNSQGGGVTELRGLAVAAGHAYLFDGAGPDGSAPGRGTSYYVTGDDNAGINGLVTAHALTPMGGKATLAFAALGGPTALTVAAGELDTSVGAAVPLVLRAGALTPPKVDNFAGPDIPTIASFTGLADIPFSSAGGDGPPAFSFLSPNDLVGIGPSLATGVAKGVNLLWYDVTQNQVRAKIGQGDPMNPPLLSNRAVGHMTTVPADTSIGAAVEFDVVWTESSSTDGGSAAALFTTPIRCVKK